MSDQHLNNSRKRGRDDSNYCHMVTRATSNKQFLFLDLEGDYTPVEANSLEQLKKSIALELKVDETHIRKIQYQDKTQDVLVAIKNERAFALAPDNALLTIQW
jgi:hypothetical protein